MNWRRIFGTELTYNPDCEEYAETMNEIEIARKEYEAVITKRDSPDLTYEERDVFTTEAFWALGKLETLLGNLDKCAVCGEDIPWGDSSRFFEEDFIHNDCWGNYPRKGVAEALFP